MPDHPFPRTTKHTNNPNPTHTRGTGATHTHALKHPDPQWVLCQVGRVQNFCGSN
jgi:hypothetical protein